MKPNEQTPEALLQFFSELEGSDNEEEECEIHYGCSCVIQKGRKAAQMLVDVQKVLGVEPGTAAPAADADAQMTAQIMEVERALTEPSGPAEPDPNAEALSEAEGEIDRLLLQNVELKEQNTKLRDKMRDLYKQIERLHTRQEMSKLLGTLDQKIEEEAEKEEGGGEGDEEAVNEAGPEEDELAATGEEAEEATEDDESGLKAETAQSGGDEEEATAAEGAEEAEAEAEMDPDEAEAAADPDREKN